MDPTTTPAPNTPVIDDPVTRYNARLGVIMFLFYFTLYAGFILITTFKYEWMATPVVGGLNLAIVYGTGLIVVAIVMAGKYVFLCKR